MEQRESSERKSFLIKVILIIILLLLSFLSTILYVYLYPKTRVELYNSDGIIKSFQVKRYSTLADLQNYEKDGYRFLYWTYEDERGAILDYNRELDEEVVRLYANYEALDYNITYHVQYYNVELQRYEYKVNPMGCMPTTYTYGVPFTLPTGRNQYGELYPDFESRVGFHFVGWTTKIVTQNDPTVNDYLTKAGESFTDFVPRDIDFYDYWEKDEYKVTLHTGIQYELGNDGKPLKDENGEYIIKNLNVADDPFNAMDSVITCKDIKYLDNAMDYVAPYLDISLTEKNAGNEYGEYEFVGWYLDEDYHIGVDDFNVNVMVDDMGVPYFGYQDANGEQRIYAVAIGLDEENKPIYSFDMYSKWARKTYTVTFMKNASGYKNNVEAIELYRVIQKEDGAIDGWFGKYYNDGFYSAEGVQNGGHYSKFRLDDNSVVSDEFKNNYTYSGKKYKLVSWSDNPSINAEGVNKYSVWTQVAWSSELGVNRQTGAVSYENAVYTQTTDKETTLYARWMQLYSLKLAYNSNTNAKSFYLYGITGEWITLPDIAGIEAITGDIWENKHRYFAGWTTSTYTSLATQYLDKLESGEINPDFKYTFGTSSGSLVVIWKLTPYTITFKLNDGTEANYSQGTYFATNTPFYPTAPAREGYIFEGWSKTKYADGAFAKLKRQDKNSITSDQNAYSNTKFSIDGDETYYAVWSVNYTFEYNPNGGELKANVKNSFLYSELGANDLMVTLTIGKYTQSSQTKTIGVTRENYNMKGWKIATGYDGAGGYIYEVVNVGTQLIFDFYDQKYHLKSAGINVSEDKKTPFVIENGKIVFEANWEPITYKIRIYDTLVDPDNLTARVTIAEVAFGEEFTFPTTNSLGEKFNNKLGHQLLGFAQDTTGTGLLPYEESNMPKITMIGALDYYTIYEESTIEVKYKFEKTIDDETIFVDFDPSIKYPNCTYGTNIPYGVTLKLPSVTTSDYNEGNSYKFKYWYYLDAEGNEVQIADSSVLQYHDENNVLTIIAKFEIETYIIKLELTNPYDGSNVFYNNTFKSVVKGASVTAGDYLDIQNQIKEWLQKTLVDGNTLAERVISADNMTLQGYQLSGFETSDIYGNSFNIGNVYNSTSFNILGFNTNILTIRTIWTPTSVGVVYKTGIEDTADEYTDTNSYNFKSNIQTLSGDIFTLGGGVVINSWYTKNLAGEDVFIECQKGLTGISNSKYLNVNTLVQDLGIWDTSNAYGVKWNDDGSCVITLYANTAQNCTISYKYYDYESNSLKEKQLQFFYATLDSQELMEGATSDIEKGDMKFEGWYLNGFKVSNIHDVIYENNYTATLYANLTFKVNYYNVVLNGNVSTNSMFKTASIDTLKLDTNEYLTTFKLEDIDVSEYLLDGFDYYGLKDMSSGYIYSRDAITSTDGVHLPLYNDINLLTYFTTTRNIIYKLNDSSESFVEEETTDLITISFKMGYDKVLAHQVKIEYSAEKLAHSFAGWKIQYSDGSVLFAKGQLLTISDLGASTNDITFVPVFNSPDAGTIQVKIRLYYNDNHYSLGEDEGRHIDIDVLNGDSYVFKNNTDDSINWTSNTSIITGWKRASSEDKFNIGNAFAIPNAVVADTIYEFVAIWTETYPIEFLQPDNYKNNASWNPKLITLKQGEVYTLSDTPAIEDDAVTFLNWQYNYTDSNGVAKIANIRVGDKIVLGADNFSVERSLEGESGRDTYYLPKPDAFDWCYRLIGVWSSTTYAITVNITDPEDPNNITYTKSIEVDYGTSFASARDILSLLDNNATINENDSYGIIGWAVSADATSADESLITNIIAANTIYSVWSSKYAISFATTDANSNEIEYGDISAINGKFFLPNQTVDINGLIKSIYFKGQMTVYFEDGKYVVVGSSGSDYYKLVGYKVNSLAINDITGNVLPAFKTLSEAMTITPVFERVFQVQFKNNTNALGGDLITSLDTTYLRTSESLSLNQLGTITRAGYTFVGWNTDMNAITGISSINNLTADTTIYAIWESNRSAEFNILNSDMSYSNVMSVSFDKNNKLVKNKVLTEKNNLYQAEGVPTGHEIYVFNYKNYYLDGYLLTISGVQSLYTLDTLCAIDFGDDSIFDQNSNVTIILNTKSVTTINFLIDPDDNVSGGTGDTNNIASDPMYVAYLDETRVGALVDGGTFEEVTLPEPNSIIVRDHYTQYAWSTSSQDGASGVTRYKFGTSQMTISSSSLKNIIQTVINQEYNLYLEWQLQQINVNINSIANVTTDSGAINVSLIDPYEVYSTSINGNDITWTKTSIFIKDISGKTMFINNTDTAQLPFNSSFYLEIANYSIAGYALVGYSTIMHKLGEGADLETTYNLGEIITLNAGLLSSENTLDLYPVYSLMVHDISIVGINGKISYSSENVMGVGFVADYTGLEESIVDANTYKTLSLSRFDILRVKACESIANYEFTGFDATSLGTTDATDSSIRIFNASTLLDNSHTEHDHEIIANFAPKVIKISFLLEYEKALQSGLSDDGKIVVSGYDPDLATFEQTINTTNRNYTISTQATNNVGVSYTNSTYYKYNLKYNDTYLELSNGNIDLSKIDISAVSKVDGAYPISISIEASPISFAVTFVMHRGAFNSGAILRSTNNTYVGVDGYQIINNTIIAYKDSQIYLPNADTESDNYYENFLDYSNGGRFLGFYKNGDSELKTYVDLTDLINTNVTFVEDADSNAFIVQYSFNGNLFTKQGIISGSEITIGDGISTSNLEKLGYQFVCWTEDGNEYINGSTLSITKNHMFTAKYVGQQITIIYNYNNGINNIQKTINYSVDSEFKLATSDELVGDDGIVNLDITDNEYLYGWQNANSTIFGAGNYVTFSEVGYMYSDANKVISLNAVISDQQKYKITFDVSEMSDESKLNFSDQTTYIKIGLDNDYGDTRYVIGSIIPESLNSDLVFDCYTIQYSLDNGTNWVSVKDDADEDIVIFAGGTLTLIAPISAGVDISIPVIYKLTPIFTSTTGTTSIEYVFTNPMNDSPYTNLGVLANGLKISSSTPLNNVHLPHIEYLSATEIKMTLDANSATMTITDNTTDGLDFLAYELIGYKMDILNSVNEITDSFNIEFGTNTNLSGYSHIVLTTIWRRNYVLNYFDNAGTEISEYRTYLSSRNGLTDTILREKLVSNSYNFLQTGYAWIGWCETLGKTISDLTDYIDFGSTITLSTAQYFYNFYPAMSQIYMVKFSTIGIDEGDLADFTFRNTLSTPEIYMGYKAPNGQLNVNIISLKDYTIATMYNNYNSTKYTFKGFQGSESMSEISAESYTFDSADIVNGEVVLSVVWEKNSFNVTFVFDGKNNSGTNVLKDYSANAIKLYGTPLCLDDILELINAKNDINAQESFDYLQFDGYYIGDTKIIANANDYKCYYELESNVEITLKFAPVYRIAYRVSAGASYDEVTYEKSENIWQEEIILGTTYNNRFPIIDGKNDEITWNTVIMTHWYAGSDMSINFFDENNTKIINSASEYKWTDDYRLILNIGYQTAYITNIHYFDNIANAKAYYENLNNLDSNSIAYVTDVMALRERYYTSVITIDDVPFGGGFIYGQDENGNDNTYPNCKHIDSLFANKTIAVNSGTIVINTVKELLSVFNDDQFECLYGVSWINNGTTDTSLRSLASFDIQSYSGTYTNANGIPTNDLYLAYTPISHGVTYTSRIVDVDGQLESDDFQNGSQIMIEYVVGFSDNYLSQLVDDGTDEYEFKRYFSKTDAEVFLDYLTPLYVFDDSQVKRVNQYDMFEGYSHVDWKVALVDSSGNITELKTLAECGLSKTEAYNDGQIIGYKITGFNTNITLVQIKSEVKYNVTFNVYSEDNSDLKLNLKYKRYGQYGSENEISLNSESYIFDDETKTNTMTANLPYGSILDWSGADESTFGESRYNNYTLSYIKINGFTTSAIDGSSLSLYINETSATNENSKEIIIDAYYVVKTRNIFMRTSLDGQDFTGEISSCEYTLSGGTLQESDQIYSTSISQVVDGISKLFNLMTSIPMGATIDQNFAIPTLLGYDFVSWKYLSNGSLVDLPTAAEQINIDGDFYLVAEFAPKEVKLKFVIKDGEVESEVTGIISDDQNFTYDSNYTIPYIYVDMVDYITTSATFGGLSYEFGETIKLSLISSLDSSYTIDDATGTVTLKIYLEPTDKYYVIFKGNDKFDLSASTFPTTKDNSDYIVVQGEDLKFVPTDGNTTYYKSASVGNYNVNTLTSSEEVILYTNSVVINDDKTQISTVGNMFVGWSSDSGTTYEYSNSNSIQYTFDVILDANHTNHTIILTAMDSNYVELHFYITNPIDGSVIIKSQTDTGESSIESDYVSIVADKTNITNALRSSNATNELTAKWTTFVDNNNIYYISNKLDGNKYIRQNYKFFGWGLTQTSALTNIENYYNNNEFASLYPFVEDSNANNKYSMNVATLYTGLSTLISNSTLTGTSINLYSVWEQKNSLSFYQDRDQTNLITSAGTGYYGSGDLIDAPSPANGYNLSTDAEKWIGWTDENNVNYLFDKYNKLSYYYTAGVDKTFTPKFEAGYTVTIDLNFDSYKTLLAEYLNGYTSASVDQRKTAIGYPTTTYNVETPYNIMPNEDPLTINDIQYYSQYKYGDLWTTGSDISLNAIFNSFSDNSIYDGLIMLGINNSTILDSYFEIDKWYYKLNGEGVGQELSEADMNSFVINGANVTFYPTWKAKTLTAYVYNTLEDAQSAFNGNGVVVAGSVTFELGIGWKTLQSELSLLESVFESTDTNFKAWKSFDNAGALPSDAVLSANPPIINNLYLFPEMEDVYRIMYVTGSGEELRHDDGIKMGETILLQDKITGAGSTNCGIALSLIKNVYYPKGGGMFYHYYKPSTGVGTIDDLTLTTALDYRKMTFIEKVSESSEETIKNTYNCLYIYVTNSITVNLYLPAKTNSGTTAEPILFKTFEINLGLNEICKGQVYLSNYAVENNILIDNYGSTNTPEFMGWYFDRETNPVTYFAGNNYKIYNPENRLVNYSVDVSNMTSGNYKLTTTDYLENTTIYSINVSNGVIINLFAKLAVKTIVTLGSDDDLTILKYAKLSYDGTNAYRNTLGNFEYYDISTSMYENKLKSITYKNVFGANASPNIWVETEGYIINAIDGLSINADDTLKFETSADDADVNRNGVSNQEYLNASLQKVINFSRTINDETTKGMFNKYTLNLSQVRLNGLKYNIHIQIVDLGTTYTYDNSISNLSYRPSESQDLQSFSDGENYTNNTGYKYYSYNSVTGKVTETDIVVFKYTKTSVGANTQIVFEQMIYGMQLFVVPTPTNSMEHHFTGWEISKLNCISETKDSSIFTLEFKPAYVESGKVELESDGIMVNATFALNEIASLELILNFNDLGVETNNAWINALSNSGATRHVDNTGDITSYTIALTEIGGFADSDIENGQVFAGKNITNTLNAKKVEYHNSYDLTYRTFNSSERLTLAQLLQYFWLDDNKNWYSGTNNQGYLNDNNQIYGYHNSIVSLYIDMDRAIYIDVNSRVLDYTTVAKDDNDKSAKYTIIESVNRADFKVSTTGEAYVYYNLIDGQLGDKLTKSVENTFNTFKIKQKYKDSITIEVLPDGANENHVAYKINRWGYESSDGDFTDSNNNNTIDNKHVINLDDGLIEEHFRSVELGNNSFASRFPECALKADVVADTYNVAFINNNGSTIKKIGIAYDQEIYNKARNKYYHYSYTLKSLNNDDSQITRPVFVLNNLQVSKIYTTFKHSDDGVVSSDPNWRENNYGNLTQLFSAWMMNGTAVDAEYELKLYNDDYQDIVLTARYKETTAVKIKWWDISGEEVISTIYMVTAQNNGLTAYSSGDNTYIDNTIENKSIVRGNGTFYTKDRINGEYVLVNTLEEIITKAIILTSQTGHDYYEIYPGVEITVNLNDDVYSPQAYSPSTYTFVTIGGRLVISVLTEMTGVYEPGSLIITEIDPTRTMNNGESFVGYIGYNNYNAYNFAYWYTIDITGEKVRTGTDNIGTAVTTYLYLDTVNIYGHHNPNFNVMSNYMIDNVNSANNKGGSSSIFDGNNERLETITDTNSVYYSLSPNTPSNIDFEGNVAFKQYESGIDDGYAWARLGIFSYDNNSLGKLLYSIYFKSNNTLNSIISWRIINESGIGNIIISEHNKIYSVAEPATGNIQYIVSDSNGCLYIEPMVYPSEVNVTLTNFAITNYDGSITSAQGGYSYELKDNSTNGITREVDGTDVTFKVKGGAIFKPDSNTFISFSDMSAQMQYGETSSFVFEDLTNTLEKYSINLKLKNANIDLQNRNLHNFCWQYEDKAGKWVNFTDNISVMDSDKKIRLVAELGAWTAKFGRMSDDIEQTNKGWQNTITIDGQNYTLTGKDATGKQIYAGALEYNEYSINVNNTISMTAQTLTLYTGEQLQYDANTHAFILINGFEGRTASVTLDSLSTNSYIQGWLQYTSILSPVRNASIFTGEGLEYNFYSWVEEKISINVKVDTKTTSFNGESVVAGYGVVNATISDPLEGNNPLVNLELNKVDKTYGTIVCGVGSIIRVDVSSDEISNHTFRQMNWNKNAVGGQTENTSYNSVKSTNPLYNYDINKTVDVLFDAIDTQSQYLIVDSNKNANNNLNIVKFQDGNSKSSAKFTIYGGYSFNQVQSSGYLSVDLYNFWNELIHHIQIYNVNLPEPTENYRAGTNIMLYPTNNYKIESIDMYRADKLNSIAGEIDCTTIDNGYYIMGTAESVVTSHVYGGEDIGNVNKSIVLKYNEYLCRIWVEFEVRLTNANGSTTIITDLANEKYVTGSDYSARYHTINDSHNNINYQYDLNENGFVYSISQPLYGDVQNGIIRANNNYELSWMAIVPTDMSVTNEYISTYPSRVVIANGSAELTGESKTFMLNDGVFTTDRYTMVIAIKEKMENYIAFKFSLPKEDIKFAYVKYKTNISNEFVIDNVFNAVSGTNANINTYKLILSKKNGINIKSSISYDIDGTRINIIEFVDNYNIVLAKISYETTNMFSAVGSTGWYIDYSPNHMMINTATANIDYSGSANIKKLEYEINTHDDSIELTDGYYSALQGDATLVLDLRRKPLTIVVDDNTWTTIWENNYSEWQSLENWDDEWNELAQVSGNGTYQIVVPTGTINVEPDAKNGFTLIVNQTASDYMDRQENIYQTWKYSSEFVQNKLVLGDLKVYEDNEILKILSGDSYPNEGFAIVPKDGDVSPDIYLTGSNNWYFITIPYGDYNNNVIDNYRQVEVYQGEKNSTDNNALTSFNMYKSSGSNLPIATINSISEPEMTYYISRSSLTRLFDITWIDDSGLKLTFVANQDKINAAANDAHLKTKLTGYTVVYTDKDDEVRTLTGQNNLSTALTYSKINTSIQVYPEFTNISVYSIYLDDIEIGTVVKDQNFTFDYDLTMVNIVTDSTIPEELNPVISRVNSDYTQVLKGLTVKGEYSNILNDNYLGILKISTDKTQVTSDLNNYNSVLGKKTYTFQNVTSDIKITTDWNYLGVTVNYIYSGESIETDDSDNGTYAVNLISPTKITKKYESMIVGMIPGFDPSLTAESVGMDEEFFKIIGTDFIKENNTYVFDRKYNIEHYKHDNFYVESGQEGCKLYNYYECPYCSFTDKIEYGESHLWSSLVRKYDSICHWDERVCMRDGCNAVYTTNESNHIYSDAKTYIKVDGNTHMVCQNCTDCNYKRTIEEDHFQTDQYSVEYKIRNKTYHEKIITCACSYTRSIIVQHYFEYTTIQQATCTQEGIVQRSCKFCSYSDYQYTPATGHDGQLVKTVKGCCGKFNGYEKYKCTKCGHTWQITIFMPDEHYDTIYIGSRTSDKIFYGTRDVYHCYKTVRYETYECTCCGSIFEIETDTYGPCSHVPIKTYNLFTGERDINVYGRLWSICENCEQTIINPLISLGDGWENLIDQRGWYLKT